MKYLLTSNFKVARKGSHVTATGNDFIYDSESDELSLGQLQEIAEANKLKVVGKKKAEYQSNLNEALSKMENVAEQNGPTQTEIVDQIVKDGHAAGKSDDDMLIEIVKAGISFRRAGKMFKETFERLGLRTSVKDVKEIAAKLLAELNWKPETYSDVEQAVSKVLAKSPEGAEKGQAIAAVKAYAKANEFELPKRPKGARGAIGFKGDAYEWILANQNATKEELAAYLESKGKNVDAYVKSLWPVVELVRKAVEQAKAA